MKKSDLELGKNNPNADIFVNFDERLGDITQISIYDLLNLDYIENVDDLLEYDIRHIEDCLHHIKAEVGNYSWLFSTWRSENYWNQEALNAYDMMYVFSSRRPEMHEIICTKL